MPRKHVKEFITRMKADTRFRNSILDAPNASARKNIAKAAGFDFTSPEYVQVLSDVLSIKDLEQVIGGQCTREQSTEGKCGEGKCGEGKCGEGEKTEGKCGEGKKTEGKCGEGKCGEGKCGEGK